MGRPGPSTQARIRPNSRGPGAFGNVERLASLALPGGKQGPGIAVTYQVRFRADSIDKTVRLRSGRDSLSSRVGRWRRSSPKPAAMANRVSEAAPRVRVSGAVLALK